jgi:hypothetical protein
MVRLYNPKVLGRTPWYECVITGGPETSDTHHKPSPATIARPKSRARPGVQLTATLTHNARSAMAVARAAYVRMAATVLPRFEDERMKRVAERAFGRGHEILLGLEATATDVALSVDAAGALDAHIRAIEDATDLGGAMSWFDLFPEIMRDVRRDTDLLVLGIYRGGAASPHSRNGDEESTPAEGYRPAHRQRALALAA